MQIAQNMRKEEFLMPVPTFTVRAATTVNGTLSSAFDNGSIIDTVTLVTGDLILVKNQTTASQNGVYIVQAAGNPVRHPDYDAHLELHDAHVIVSSGDVNLGTSWYQNSILTSLSDNQVWSRTANPQKFIIPENVRQIFIEGIGGGGGGGEGGGNTTGATGSGEGGAGGGGAWPNFFSYTVIPNDILTVTLGAGGLGGNGNLTSNGANGADGDSTTVVGSGLSLTFLGATGGAGGLRVTGGPASGTTGVSNTFRPSTSVVASGNGGTISAVAPLATAGTSTFYAAGGSLGAGSADGGGGGGGAASYGNGGNGGAGVNGDNGLPGSIGGVGAGGGGGGGAGDALGGTIGGKGGNGGPGKVTFYWIE